MEMAVAGTGMKAGQLLAGKRVEGTAQSFDRLGNLLGGPGAGAFEQQVLDEMADSVEVRRFVARPRPTQMPTLTLCMCGISAVATRRPLWSWLS